MSLIDSIKNKKTADALEIIKNGNFNPEYVDDNGNTALIYACQKDMPDVALALINTHKSKPEQVDINGQTA